MSEETIRVITYESTEPGQDLDGGKIFSPGYAAPGVRIDTENFPAEEPQEDRTLISSRVKSKNISVNTLEQEMNHLLSVVERLLAQAENQKNSPIKLDEIELSVEINGQGQVSILGTGAAVGGKGAITLKFKRTDV